MTDPRRRLEELIATERGVAPPAGAREAAWAALEGRLAVAAGGVTAGSAGVVKLGLAVGLGVSVAVAVGLARGAPEGARVEEAGPRDIFERAPGAAEDAGRGDMDGVPGPAGAGVEGDIPVGPGPAGGAAGPGPGDMPVGSEAARIGGGAGARDIAAGRSTDALVGPGPRDIRGAAAPEEAGPGDSLSAELAALREIHAALRDGRPGEARARADEALRRWPRGAFREEVEAARVLGLCGEDGGRAGRRALAAFERRWPTSLYGERLRQRCGA